MTPLSDKILQVNGYKAALCASGMVSWPATKRAAKWAKWDLTGNCRGTERNRNQEGAARGNGMGSSDEASRREWSHRDGPLEREREKRTRAVNPRGKFRLQATRARPRESSRCSSRAKIAARHRGIQKLLPIAIFVAASVKFVAESAVKWSRTSGREWVEAMAMCPRENDVSAISRKFAGITRVSHRPSAFSLSLSFSLSCAPFFPFLARYRLSVRARTCESGRSRKRQSRHVRLFSPLSRHVRGGALVINILKTSVEHCCIFTSTF